MYLYLGNDFFIPLTDVVAILNINSCDDSFLKSDYSIKVSGKKKISSKVIGNSNKINSVYLSLISSNTLKNRSTIKF